ncbi:MAG: DMT family transporter [Gammaproteobacteria bacterium]|nr:DMT family transporter [Gammaproteobacteria bacterium]MDH3857321.1 DMT family transporter [Gammaproteobacteria bacterium]
MNDNHQPRAYFFLLVATLCWGLNANFSRLAVGEISPMQIVTFRWLGVVLLMLVFARENIIRDWPMLRRHLPFLAIMGGFGFTVFNALFYVAAHHTSAINIGILQGAVPIFVLLGGFLAFGQRITALQSIGVTTTLIGVVTVASGGKLVDLAGFTINRGDLFMLIACFIYAAYSLGLSRGPKVSSLGLFSIMAFVAWLISLPLILVETYLQGWQTPSTKGWIIVTLITLLPSLLAQLFFIFGVKLIGPARAGAFYNLVPVFASILAVVILKEVFELYHAISLGLVLGGIWLSERGKPKQA